MQICMRKDCVQDGVNLFILQLFKQGICWTSDKLYSVYTQTNTEKILKTKWQLGPETACSQSVKPHNLGY